MTSSVHRTVRAYWVGDIFCGVKRIRKSKIENHKATNIIVSHFRINIIRCRSASTTQHHNLPPNKATHTTTPPTAPDKPENNPILTCLKKHCIATRLTIKHANRIRCNKYGSALLQMLVREPKDALKSSIKTATNEKNTRQYTATIHLYSIRDPTARRITCDPAQA